MKTERRMSQMSKDYDQTSRDKIRNDIHSNFFVEAGAGSGKTSVLVDRMAAMVEGGIDISKICAITFTKAAAGEFYARFQQKLSTSDSENAKKALKDIDLCFMGTIDSFCNMVLSEHPAAAGIPSNAVVVEDDAMYALYMREYSRILKGEAGEELRKKAERFSKKGEEK
jgi:ATP-dependent exoDNAse (exonuclease V) beta subunit